MRLLAVLVVGALASYPWWNDLAVGPADDAPRPPALAGSTAGQQRGGCTATLSPSSGVPWRPGWCASPGYANHRIPRSPVVDRASTASIRTLPGAILNIDEFTEPIHFAASGTPMRRVKCLRYTCVGGTAAPVTGHERVAPGTDGQLIVVDTQRRRSYEFWRADRDPDGTVAVGADGTVRTASMNVVDLDGTGNRTAGGRRLNITGAGVSRLLGVVRANEIRAAAISPRTAIPHALSVSLPDSSTCADGFREPATKTDGRSRASSCIEEGSRFQLDPSYDCSSLPAKLGQAICHALQTYGAFDVDTNSSRFMVFYGQHRRSWSTGSGDYRAAGIEHDYSDLHLPMTRLRTLETWSGR